MELKDFLPFLPVLPVIVGLLIVYFQIQSKRRDEKLAVQINRLNQQLNDLYGPLYALYEIGEKNWFLFLEEYSNHKDIPKEFLSTRH